MEFLRYPFLPVAPCPLAQFHRAEPPLSFDTPLYYLYAIRDAPVPRSPRCPAPDPRLTGADRNPTAPRREAKPPPAAPAAPSPARPRAGRCGPATPPPAAPSQPPRHRQQRHRHGGAQQHPHTDHSGTSAVRRRAANRSACWRVTHSVAEGVAGRRRWRRRRREDLAAAAAGGFGGRGTMSGRLSEGAIAVSVSAWAGVYLRLGTARGETRAWAPRPARSRGEKQARSGAWSRGGFLVQRWRPHPRPWLLHGSSSSNPWL